MSNDPRAQIVLNNESRCLQLLEIKPEILDFREMSKTGSSWEKELTILTA